jgi:hypothetical protein
MHIRITELMLFSVNGLLGYLTLLDVQIPDIQQWNINIITAVAGLCWLVLERLPKILFFISKSWEGIKKIKNGEAIDKDFVDDIYKKKEDEN